MSAATVPATLRQLLTRQASEAASAALGDPAWLKAKRAEAWTAWERLNSDPDASGSRFLPRAKDLAGFAAEAGPAAALPVAPSLDSEWGPLGAHAAFGCTDSPAPLVSEAFRQAGARILPLAQALKEQPGLLEQHLFSRTRVDETAAAALNAAFLGQGTLVWVPKGARLARPVRLSGVHTGGQAGFFPRTLVVLEPGAELTLIDELSSATPAPGLAAQVVELVLGEASRLTYIHHQALNTASAGVLRQRTLLSRDAYLYTLAVASGAAFSTAYLESRMDGEGGQVDLLGLALLAGDQEAEIRTLQDHNARGGNSDALVKSILRGRSHFFFDGVVKIHKAGQSTNAFQSNPNLLLSADCKAESIPTLEIEADDVACKHAASIGSIDEEVKFYLLSRGIPPRDTEDIIVEGFAAELASRLPQAELQEAFSAILSRLAKRAG